MVVRLHFSVIMKIKEGSFELLAGTSVSRNGGSTFMFGNATQLQKVAL